MKLLTALKSILFLSVVLLIIALAIDVLDASEPDISRGKEIYAANCRGCHGRNGDGNGLAARYLDPLPRDFTKGKFKFRTTPSGSLPTDENISKIIRDGVRRTSMPGWKHILGKKDISDVVGYLKTFSEKFVLQDPSPEVVIPNEAPDPTKDTIYEGKMIYMLMECWSCHGPNGRADGPNATGLKDDWDIPILLPDFQYDAFKGGEEPQEIYRTFSTGLSGTPMPAYEDDLFGYARENVVGDYTSLTKSYSEKEIKVFEDWAKTMVTEDELYSKDEDEMYDVFRQRKWALVHYVNSLREKKGILHTLFVKDYELIQ
ncbi:MAG: c-type cytochrome [Candidatus Peribacteraceae bacterium]|nr:c-type cytochrome [Candidatus Peribacteraceae bacterium]